MRGIPRPLRPRAGQGEAVPNPPAAETQIRGNIAVQEEAAMDTWRSAQLFMLTTCADLSGEDQRRTQFTW